MKKLIWLDDCRDPFENPDWLIFSPIGKDVEVIWVQTYSEFIQWITENGLPEGICFDHDLGDEVLGYPEDEKTGYDCAKWLVDYCLERNIDIPEYNIQSSNPVGSANIESILNNYHNFYVKSKIK